MHHCDVSEWSASKASGIAMQAVEAVGAVTAAVHIVPDGPPEEGASGGGAPAHLAVLLPAAPLPHQPLNQLPGLCLVCACACAMGIGNLFGRDLLIITFLVRLVQTCCVIGRHTKV